MTTPYGGMDIEPRPDTVRRNFEVTKQQGISDTG